MTDTENSWPGERERGVCKACWLRQQRAAKAEKAKLDAFRRKSAKQAAAANRAAAAKRAAANGVRVLTVRERPLRVALGERTN